jgi:hypothetical protein
MNIRLYFSLIAVALAAAAAAAAAPAEIKVGDSWTFDARNGYNRNLLTTYRIDVIGVSGAGIAARVTNDKAGTVTSERFTRNWNPIFADWSATQLYEFSPAYAEFPDRLEPGVKWQGQTVARDVGTGRELKMTSRGTVVGNEHVRVPAGEFNAIKISRETVLDDAEFWRHRTHVIDYEWFVPELGRSVKRETSSSFFENTGMHPVEHSGDWTVYELTAYQMH